MEKIGFFQEAPGVNSATRLAFLVGTLWNLGICTYLVITGVESVAILAFFAGVEGVLTGLKVGQKFAEKKEDAG